MARLYGGIEAGGTKFVCTVASGPDDVRATVQLPTTSPEETIGRTLAFFREAGATLAAAGIAAFGPVDLDPHSPTYGFVTSTPKAGWPHTRLLGAVQEGLGVPVGFDTDVNGAALGENRWGAAQGLDTFVYITVGTGVGGGGMVAGRLMHGLVHPEMGHMRLPHDWEADPFPGLCPYHGDCLEGLANGPAMKARWGQPAETLPPDHPAWALEAQYLALAVANLVCTLSPQRVILGGGVMQAPGLLSLVRSKVQFLLNGYVQAPEILEQIESYIVAPGLGNQAGVLGAVALAERACALTASE
jgi:fructokinase